MRACESPPLHPRPRCCGQAPSVTAVIVLRIPGAASRLVLSTAERTRQALCSAVASDDDDADAVRRRRFWGGKAGAGGEEAVSAGPEIKKAEDLVFRLCVAGRGPQHVTSSSWLLSSLASSRLFSRLSSPSSSPYEVVLPCYVPARGLHFQVTDRLPRPWVTLQAAHDDGCLVSAF